MANAFSDTIIKFIGLGFLAWILLLGTRSPAPGISRMDLDPVFPSCPTVSSSWNKSELTSFLVDIRRLSILGHDLGESKLEDTILHSKMNNKRAVGYYLRMTREVSRLFEPALRQYIQKVVPNLELAITSSKAIITSISSTHTMHSNSSGIFLQISRLGERRLEDRRLEDVVSDSLQLYSTIQHDHHPRSNTIDRILVLLQDYLDDLASILSSSQDCKLHDESAWIAMDLWKAVRSAIGYKTNSAKTLHDCEEMKFREGKVHDLVQGLRESNQNLRSRFNSFQFDLEDLGEQSLNFLLRKMGRNVPVEQYLVILSMLACRCSRIRDLLTLISM